MKIFRIKNRRNSLATNSSSTHSVIYKNKGQVFEDLGVFDNRYYDRCTETIAASREAKIRYIFANIFEAVILLVTYTSLFFRYLNWSYAVIL